MDIASTPILVGGGQIRQSCADPIAAMGPIALMEAALWRAAGDARIGEHTLAAASRLTVIRTNSSDSETVAAELGASFGIAATRTHYSEGGGFTPQVAINAAAARIAQGVSDLEAIVGGEALDTLSRAQRLGITLPYRFSWPGAGSGSAPQEIAHGLYYPIATYPLFENAIAATDGRPIAQHITRLGERMAPFTAVAARNPYAWFPHARTAQELSAETPANRMIGFPYTKYMNAVMTVDQAAAVILTSVERARTLGIPEERWIYLHGCADAHDHWHVLEREEHFRSPAIEVVGRETLAMAGRHIEEVAHFDLYSCFPSMVELAVRALGLNGRKASLTVTGGLPYAGGPGNNYVTHAVATMMDVLRADSGSFGLVTANGYYATRHAAGLYSRTPPARPFRPAEPTTYQAEIDARSRRRIVDRPEGRARIVTYTVLHGRDGEPETGIVVGELADGGRFVAHTPADHATLDALKNDGTIGRTGRVEPVGERNLFLPD